MGDRPGPGRRPRLTESERSQIIALVKTTPPGRPMLDPWLNGLAAAEEEDAPGVWTLDTVPPESRSVALKCAGSC
nr:helix-turn-helix domain-containing protein [Nonomuraea sp. SYSU D8015]